MWIMFGDTTQTGDILLCR